MIADGLLAQEGFALEQGILSLFTLCDVADIALDNLLGALLIDITDEFHLDQPPILRPERQILVSNVFIPL